MKASHKKLIALFCLLALSIFLLLCFFGLRDVKSRANFLRTRIELTDFCQAISSYAKVYGTAPTGTASTIFATLTGENEQKIIFLNVKSSRKNSAGEYTDTWRTPFQITIAKTNIFVVRSAGPNRIFGDADDFALTNSLSK